MSEAVDNQAVSSDVYTIKFSPTWAPWVVNTVDNRFLTRTECLKHPATIRNVRGSFGQWPRSPWHKWWYRASIPVSSWETAAKPGHETWFNPRSTTPVAGDFLHWAGAQWEDSLRFLPSAADQFMTEQVARTKTLQKVAQKKWDLGVTVLEFKQTAGLVTDVATSMVTTLESCLDLRKKARRQINDLFRRVRQHDDFYRAAAEVGMKDISLLEDIRSRWMQYQFGIKPALSDVDSAVTALDTAIHGYENGMLVRAKAGHSTTGRRNASLPVANAPFSTVVSFDTEVEVHCSVSYRIPTEGVPLVTTLGLDNPYNIAWEVTRLSWMCDYVVGIGDWLQSFTAANGLEYIDGSMSSTWRSISNQVNVELYDNTDVMWVKRPKTTGLYLESGRFTRELLASGLMPGVVPQIKSQMGVTQLANSIFALTSLLGGSRGLR